MALKNPYGSNKSAYHKVSGILLTRRDKKICIQTQIFASKKAYESGDKPIAVREHKFKQATIIEDSYVYAFKYYEANDDEVTASVDNEIKRIEQESEEKLSMIKKREIKNIVAGRLAAKMAEVIGLGNWNRVIELQEGIVKSEYEMLKLLSEFSNAEEV